MNKKKIGYILIGIIVLLLVLIITIFLKPYNNNNNNNNDETVDIFIKTYHKDFIWLEYCIKSIKKFCKGFRDVVIVCDDDGNLIPENITKIMPLKVFYEKVPTNIDFMTNIGYNWQQNIKLNWIKYTDADVVFIFDSDYFLVEPTIPNNYKLDGKYYWIYRDWNKAGGANIWKVSTDNILGIYTHNEAMTSPCFVLRRDTTIKFHEYIKNKYNTTSFWEMILREHIATFSEFNIFGNFIYYIYDTNYKKIMVEESKSLPNHKIIQSWSWGGLKEEEIKKREEILNTPLIDTFENKKILIHKILTRKKIGDNAPPSGLGDIIKGTIGLYSIAKNYNYNFYLDLNEHPISKFIKTTIPDKYINIKDDVYELFYGTNIFSYDELPNKVIEIMKEKDVGIFETNSLPSITDYSTDIDNENIKNLFIPNDNLQEKINNVKTKLGLDNYSVLHIRIGDDKINKSLNSKTIKSVEETLSDIILPDNILLLSDSKELKGYLHKKYKFKILESDIIHLGYLNSNNKEGIESTLIDFFLICGAEKIYSLSVYFWSSGFSSMASRLYNIPIEKYEIENI